MKKIYFVRHGQTLLNHFRKMQGWVDSPLTDKGIEQAIQTGIDLKDIHFDKAYSSDMSRAVRTLNLILSKNEADTNVTPEVKLNLREVYFGYFEGLDSKETWNIIGGPHGEFVQNELVKQHDILKIRDFMKAADPFHEAESGDEIKSRIHQAVLEIQNDLADGQTAIVVTHGTYLRTLGILFSEHDFLDQPNNGSVTTLDVTSAPQIIEYSK